MDVPLRCSMSLDFRGQQPAYSKGSGQGYRGHSCSIATPRARSWGNMTFVSLLQAIRSRLRMTLGKNSVTKLIHSNICHQPSGFAVSKPFVMASVIQDSGTAAEYFLKFGIISRSSKPVSKGVNPVTSSYVFNVYQREWGLLMDCSHRRTEPSGRRNTSSGGWRDTGVFIDVGGSEMKNAR